MAQLDIKQIRGASQSGYVLTTDVNGLATWSQSQTITEITISGTQNGSNRNFVLSDSLTYPQNLFFINGQLVQESVDYTISGTALTIDSSIPAPISTDTLRLFGTIVPLLGSGVLSVNGLSNTYQYLTSSSSDGNIDININSSIDTHSFDVNVLFNDSGTSSTDVWSADKIISYIGVGVVVATGATGVTGSVGVTGATGPTAVSTDVGNGATIGTDGLIYVSTLSTKFHVELMDYLEVDIYVPYNLKVDSVSNVLNSPTISIKDDGAAYTLGQPISMGSKVTVTANTFGVVTLNCTKL